MFCMIKKNILFFNLVFLYYNVMYLITQRTFFPRFNQQRRETAFPKCNLASLRNLPSQRGCCQLEFFKNRATKETPRFATEIWPPSSGDEPYTTSNFFLRCRTEQRRLSPETSAASFVINDTPSVPTCGPRSQSGHSRPGKRVMDC